MELDNKTMPELLELEKEWRQSIKDWFNEEDREIEDLSHRIKTVREIRQQICILNT